ncbi:MAG TPA: AI-2E family transporter [Candidatus Acidoferrum sp.]|nr:AI-2E family transporter [Candidatus Acidoferrum sp.]
MKTDSLAKTTSDRLTTVLSYGALLLLGYLAYLIVEPFLVPLAWSAVFAIFFFPLHEKLLKKLKPTTAALASTLLVTFLLIVPALVVLWYTTREALDAAGRVQSAWLQPGSAVPPHIAEKLHGLLPKSLQNTDFSAPLRQGAERIASFLATKFAALLKNLFAFFVDLFILLFSLFFMFRDGDSIVRGVRHLLPFDREIQNEVMRESRDLIFASVAIGLLIAAIQGTLGGAAFAVTGIRSPVFWGVLIAFFSLVPVVGSALIWVPVALWLAITGSWGKAIVVVAICGGVAGVADNIIRPLLLKNRTRLNELLLFLSVLGGIQVFGLLGLVIGPTIVAAALGVFRVYMQKRDQLQGAGS